MPESTPASSTPPRVSVVIATYNMGAYLPLAIRSALEQTTPVHDIQVIDDGSTDGTHEVMRQFADHPQVRYQIQPNGGQAKAKNRGIRAAEGEFIGFLDADDLWTPNKTEIELAAFAAQPQVGIVYTDFMNIDEQGNRLPTPKREYFSGRISGRLLVDNFVNYGAALVRRECFEELGVFDETLPMAIDYDLWLRFSAKYEFLYLDEVTILYRRWSGQMSHNYEKRLECAMAIMERFLEAHPGLVDPATVREAWAHTYVSRGQVTAQFRRDRYDAFRDYLLALRYVPTYLQAYKEIVKLMVR
jgi:glycosyltransferase involved in cell wall biosynthesis